MSRKHYNINYNWNFQIANQKEIVNLPHNINNIPLNYFKHNDIHKEAVYSKVIEVPADFSTENKLYLTFYGIGSKATIFCNDIQIFKNFGAYNQFSVDLTDNALNNKNLNIVVEISNFEDITIPPFGGKMDYLTFGGIYRKVSLDLLNKDHIEGEKFETDSLGNCVFTCLNDYKEMENFKFFISEKNSGENLQIFNQSIKGSQSIKFKYLKVKLWSLENPILYKVVIKNSKDEITKIIGFRHCEFKKDGFYLNEKKIKLLGLNRHQSYPYVGYAMSENFQKQDALILKNNGINIVRTSHYPQDTEFLNTCDEIGLLVFEEIPGWQHINEDPIWLKRTQENVRLMIQRDFHHPSTILWGVRINESQDNHELYLNTNKISHEMDSTRQTGGVRYLTHSELLEDVYTFNDFSHQGNNPGLKDPKKVTKNKKAPYLVTEYCGHMFPVKRFDNESRRMEFSLRHARILNDMYLNDRISGCIGWCFFDYNTHDNFGNGDLICYHGVTDMFRIPKFAFYIYKAQNCNKPFVVSGTFFDAGDFSQFYQTLYVFFSNTDSIKLYRNKEYMGEFFPNYKNYPGLKHPPIIIKNLLENRLKSRGFTKKKEIKLLTKIIEKGRLNSNPAVILKYALPLSIVMLKHKLSIKELTQLGMEVSDFAPLEKPDWTIEGIIKGETVCTQTLNANKTLSLKVSSSQTDFSLKEYETFQVAQVSAIAIFPGFDFPVPYCFEGLALEATGSIELYGTPNLISLQGGTTGIYIRTTGKTGEGNLKIKSSRFPEKNVNFTVKE